MVRLVLSAVLVLGAVAWGMLPSAHALPNSDDDAIAVSCSSALSLSPLQYSKRAPEWIQIGSSDAAEIGLSEDDALGWVARIIHRDPQGRFWTEVLQLHALESLDLLPLDTPPQQPRWRGQEQDTVWQMDLGRFRLRVVNHYRQRMRGIWVLERSVLQRIRRVTTAN